MKAIALLSALILTVGSCNFFTQGNRHKKHQSTHAVTQKQQIELPAIHDNDMIITHTGYTLSYDLDSHNPKWVAWTLTRDKLIKRFRRSNEYRGDERISTKDRVEKYTYNNPAYDRGHMCPSGDVRYDRQAQADCFYMTNICPQIKKLNQTWWEHVESATRRWAQREGTVYVCCGPIYLDNAPVRTMGRGVKIRIPDAFFKVILSLKPGEEKAIGFYYTNNNDRQTMEYAKRSVDEIEAITGLDFFCSLPDKLENRVESQCNLRSWN